MMTSPFLRRVRIVFSAVILIFFILVFVDFRSFIPEEYYDFLLFLQFVPSAVNFIDAATVAASGFLIVLFLTLISGRTYCSFLCPLGIGQDLFSRIGGRIKKRFRRFGYKKPFTIVRYSLLAITLIVTIVWGIHMIILLDPYSIFGRFITFFAKPVVLLLNNFVSGILGKFDIYTVPHFPVKGFQLLS